MIVLSIYECPASLGSETILSEALVLMDTPQCQSRRPRLELSYSISVARGTAAACCIGEGNQIHHFRAAYWMHQLRTLASFKPVVDGPSRLQLILRLTDWSHKMLQQLTLDSSVAEVYCCVEEQLGVNKCELSLVCRHHELNMPIVARLHFL